MIISCRKIQIENARLLVLSQVLSTFAHMHYSLVQTHFETSGSLVSGCITGQFLGMTAYESKI